MADSNENLDVLSQLVEVNGEVNGRRVCSKKFDMRCSPCRLYSIVKSLDEESKELVREMGFGSLLGMRNCIVRIDLIFWLLERFDPVEGSIQLKKQKVMLNSNVFANVIGIVDGGEQLPELEIEERKKNRYHEKISLKHIESILKSGEKDKFFVKHFTMYVVGTLLMPTTATYVVRRIENSMECINDARSVRSKNWASMSFKFLIESIRQFKEKKSHYVCGCLYFLQLFFLHHVDGYNHYVDRSICPMSWWGESECKLFFRWIESCGGYNNIRVQGNNYIEVRQLVHEEGDSGSVRADNKMNEEIRLELSKIGDQIMYNVSTSFESLVQELSLGTNGAHDSEYQFDEKSNFLKNEIMSEFAKLRNEVMVGIRSGFLGVKGNELVSKTDLGTQRMIVNIGDGHRESEFVNKGWTDRTIGEIMWDESNVYRVFNAYVESEGLQIGPFRLQEPISIDDFSVAMFAFDFRLSVRETLVVICDYELQRYYFRTLLPRGHIDAQVIDVFGLKLNYEELAKRQGKKGICWILPTRKQKMGHISISHAKGTGFGAPNTVKLNMCDKLIIPVLDEDVGHWIMVELVMKEVVAVVWDSMCSPNKIMALQNHCRTLLISLDKDLAEDVQESFDGGWNFSQFQIHVRNGIPHQDNGDNCGVFLMKFMLSTVMGFETCYEFNPTQWRLLFAVDLIRSTFNERCDQIVGLASSHFVRHMEANLHVHNDSSNLNNGGTSSKIRNPQVGPVVTRFLNKKERDKFWARLGRKRRQRT